jgi:hypothetical protein
VINNYDAELYWYEMIYDMETISLENIYFYGQALKMAIQNDKAKVIFTQY